MKKALLFLVVILLFSCSKDDSENTNVNSINLSDLTGTFNLFPLAINPEFTSVNEVNIGDNSLVGIVNFGGTLKVFPYVFMTHNEIVNDTHQGFEYAFSYCPITKSSVAFKRNGIYRASGYLFNSNLTPWDEETETIWSQMLLKGIVGEKESIKFNTVPVVETTWKTVKDYFPSARVVTADLFLTRSSSPPDEEGDSTNSGNSPELNDFVYGIITGSKATIFKYADFANSSLINKTILGQKYIVFGDSGRKIINAFKVNSFENYSSLEGEFPYILENLNGIKFDIFGRGTNGSSLEKPDFAYVAIWTAWLDFYDNFEFEE
jgi:hypothetical protein